MSQMTQCTAVLRTNTISSVVFDVIPRLLLETRLACETRLLSEEIWYQQLNAMQQVSGKYPCSCCHVIALIAWCLQRSTFVWQRVNVTWWQLTDTFHDIQM